MKQTFSQVLAVNILDDPIGIVEKLEAHKNGILHRAFSIFLTDSDGNMLLQKRAKSKYHSGGLWSNACCSHPTGDIMSDANDRLFEELGIRTELSEISRFVYRREFSDGLIEYEFDHVLVGKIRSGTVLSVDPEEAEETRFISLDELEKELLEKPESFTAWFITAAPMVIKYLKEKEML